MALGGSRTPPMGLNWSFDSEIWHDCSLRDSATMSRRNIAILLAVDLSYHVPI